MKPTHMGAILISTSNGDAMARFYRDNLGLPLKEERHGPHAHWGCELGSLHFAIHPDPKAKIGSGVAFSLEVSDVDAAVADLKRLGVKIEMEAQDRPFGRLASVRDPDGNLVYLHKDP